MRIIFLVVLPLLVISCDPYRFTILGHSKIKGRIHSPLESVDVNERYFDVHENGCVSLTLPTATQYSISFHAKLLDGEGFRILARSRVEETVIDSGVVISIRKNNTSVEKHGIALSANTNIDINTENEVFINLYNDEKYLQVILDCDTILMYHDLESRACDDIVITSIGKSSTRIYDPQWKDLELDE